MELNKLVDFLSSLFAEYNCEDYSNNGLQVEASSQVSKVAFAVDGCLESISKAADAGAQLLVVHHGISWGNGFKRLIGADAQRLKLMFDRGVSLFGMHLPLDAHVKYGNNAVIAEKLGLQDTHRFCDVRGMKIGICGTPGTNSLQELNSRLLSAKISDNTKIFDNTNGKISRVGVISGQCSDQMEICRQEGIDCFVTGEVVHSIFHSAKEHNVSIIAAGHYATETWGVKSLMPLVANLGLETIFIDAPTGL